MTEPTVNKNNKYIIEYPKTIPPLLCQDYIDLFEKNITPEQSTTGFRIPKNNITATEWHKLEKFLYKQLLIKLQDYKQKLLFHLDNYDICVLNGHLENEIYIKDFIIKKYENPFQGQKIDIKTPSRYNLLSFVFFLNTEPPCQIQLVDTIITPEKGKLLLFPETIIPKFMHEFNSINANYYVITGQFMSSLH